MEQMSASGWHLDNGGGVMDQVESMIAQAAALSKHKPAKLRLPLLRLKVW